MDVATIQALANLWLFGLMTIIILFWFIYRKPLRVFIENISSFKLKRGGTELELIKQKTEKSSALSEQIISVNPEETKQEEKSQSLLDVLVFYVKGDFEEGEKLFRKIQSETTENDDKIENDLIRLYYRFKYGDTSAQAEINKMIMNKTMSNKVASRAHLFLAYCFLEGQQYTSSISELNKALELSEKEKSKVEIITKLAEVLYKNNQKSEAFSILIKYVDELKDNILKSHIWKSIGKFYEDEKRIDYKAFAYEKALEYSPTDSSLIFDTAYLYSKIKFHQTSAYHYNNLVKIDSDNYAAVNNLGVSYGNLDFKFNRISCYKKSYEGGETLAASNYAEILIDSGLYDEAKAVLEKAKTNEEVHPNIWDSFKRLEEEFEAENSKKENIFKETIHLRQFVSKYITKLNSKRETINMQGSWKLNNKFDLEITQSGNKISSKWKQGTLNYGIDLELENFAGKGIYSRPGIFNVVQTDNVYGILSDDLQNLELEVINETENLILSLKHL
jgi:tetratricopeptide (TPR) repeat protein